MRCDCGHDAAPEGCSTGYGTDNDGKTACFACCGERDRASMIGTGRATLYLTIPNDTPKRPVGSVYGPTAGAKVSNWPGTLKLSVDHMRKGRHNMAGTRYDVWFRLNGEPWHGVQYGENTQLLHCRRTK